VNFLRIGAMGDKFTLLIADRNRNVREFLKREFSADGYSVKLAKDDRELLNIIETGASGDLLILDLDMPYFGGPEVLEHLRKLMPSLPVVIHTFQTDYSSHEAVRNVAAFLEKKGTNIDHLKSVVRAVLQRCYPKRF
jgi:DNA-binding NtrC family response regulator